jgi:ribonuclease VapC
MMIDSSVLIAILENEPEATRLIEAIADDPVHLISAVSVVETSIVILNRRGEAGVAELDAFLQEAGIETVAVQG